MVVELRFYNQMGANFSKFAILQQMTFGDGLSPITTQKILQVSTKLGQFESFMLELDAQGYDISAMEEDMRIFAMTFFVSSEYPDDRIITISETDSD